jgi:hypothetical protein
LVIRKKIKLINIIDSRIRTDLSNSFDIMSYCLELRMMVTYKYSKFKSIFLNRIVKQVWYKKLE